MGQPWSPADQSWQPESQVGPPPAPPQKRPPWPLVAGLAAAVLMAGTAGFFVGRSTVGPSVAEAAPSEVRLTSAFEQCQRHDKGGTMTLEDDGATIVIDTGSEFGSTAGMDCVLDELGTSESIKAQVGRTTAMMGVQDAEKDGIEFSWSYHPDNGVNMVITGAGASAN